MPTQQGNKDTKSQGITTTGLRLNLYFYFFPRIANHSSATKAIKKVGFFCFSLEERKKEICLSTKSQEGRLSDNSISASSLFKQGVF